MVHADLPLLFCLLVLTRPDYCAYGYIYNTAIKYEFACVWCMCVYGNVVDRDEVGVCGICLVPSRFN